MKLRIGALLLLVAAAGYLTTSRLRIDLVPFGLLLVTGLLAAGGASAMNQYIDRDLDALMRRTNERPLPRHRINPPSRALAFGFGITGAALSTAWVGINPLTASMMGLGLVVYVGVYTLGLKRAHASNIVIGGFAGSCPALAGSAAASGGIDPSAALIALLVFLWTPGHFWALAFRAREEYRRARIPMLPAIRDERTSIRAIAVSTALVPPSTLGFLVAPVFQSGLYVATAIAAGAILLALTARFVMRPTDKNVWAGYRFSGAYLATILLAMIASASLVGPA
jgi:protoheme IX farnesyltransferase